MNPPIYQVLLLEHDLEFVQYLRQMLGQTTAAAFAVSETPTFAEGLRRLVELRPDVVIIDLAIPDGGGLANIRVLQDLDASVPILVFGKADDETLALEVKHAGAADYLIKTQLTPPFLSRALIYAIERHQHENQLVDAEQKYHGFFDHIVEGVFQTSLDGHYLMANNALARIYGYDSAEELTASVTDIARKLYVEEGRRAEFIRLMQEHDTVVDFQSRIHRKTGDHRLPGLMGVREGDIEHPNRTLFPKQNLGSFNGFRKRCSARNDRRFITVVRYDFNIINFFESPG